MTDVERLLRALADAAVEFILVGGVAATVHGGSRLTLDLDVVYRRSDENIVSLRGVTRGDRRSARTRSRQGVARCPHPVGQFGARLLYRIAFGRAGR